jgi:hypothetical protein
MLHAACCIAVLPEDIPGTASCVQSIIVPVSAPQKEATRSHDTEQGPSTIPGCSLNFMVSTYENGTVLRSSVRPKRVFYCIDILGQYFNTVCRLYFLKSCCVYR